MPEAPERNGRGRMEEGMWLGATTGLCLGQAGQRSTLEGNRELGRKRIRRFLNEEEREVILSLRKGLRV